MILSKGNFSALNIGTSKAVSVVMSSDGTYDTAEISHQDSTPQAWLDSIFKAASHKSASINHISACGTAGTFVLADAYGNPIGRPGFYNELNPITVNKVKSLLVHTEHPFKNNPTPAIVNLYERWNDLSSIEQKQVCHVLPQSVWALYKLVEPEGKKWKDLSSDTNNLFAFGVNPQLFTFPTEIYDALGIPQHILPTPVRPGTFIGVADSELATAIGAHKASVYQGTVDANAEATYLLGDSQNDIGIIAGSTSVIKASSDNIPGPNHSCFASPHPLLLDKHFLTAWVTTGENIRRLSNLFNHKVQDMLKAAWDADPSLIHIMELKRQPILNEHHAKPSPAFVRSLVESSTWWETKSLQDIYEVMGAQPSRILMTGGTTKSADWMEFRAASFGKPIHVYPAIGSIGAIIPGLINNGYFSSFDEFAFSCRKTEGAIYQPRKMTPYENTRFQDWANKFG